MTPRPTVSQLVADHGSNGAYAYLDEVSKREVRRSLLKAMAIPGWQVPFASREMPVARGWGSGGLQVTLSLVGPSDTVKVIDQGEDDSVNAEGMRSLITTTAACAATTRTNEATIIQSRHRIPEMPLRPDQLLVLQVPHPEPLRRVVPAEPEALARHADGDYTAAWVDLYDDETRLGGSRSGADHPVLVGDRVLMSPSPIPRHDLAALDDCPAPILLGAGRRARVMAIPPRTRVTPLAFSDRPLRTERFGGACARCGSASSYRVESAAHPGRWTCSDRDACDERSSPR